MAKDRYRTTFLGMPVTFQLDSLGPGILRAVGTATMADTVRVGFDANIKYRVGVNDKSGLIASVMQLLAKLPKEGVE